jgi:hypothetical protein
MSQTLEKVSIIPQEEPRALAAVTPMDMLNRAVSSGADIDMIEKLMSLQERWEANQSRKLFDEALANAQGEMPKLTKNRLVNYASAKSPTGYVTYRHEDLAEVIETVKPILKKFGLAHRFRTTQEGDKITVTCVITGHGHREENSLSAGRDTSGGKNNHQEIASAVTYLERYTLKAALGLAAAHDDDAGKAEAADAITLEQVEELVALADEVGADKEAFCRYFKVGGFADITTKNFPRAIAALNKKRAK